MKAKINKQKYSWVFLLLCIVSVIPLFDLFHPGLPVTHDGQDHVARIANFYKNIQEGIIVPRWAGNLNWGYGHPILMFLYPIPSYASSFFHFLGFSFVDSLKIIFGISFILSGLTMYLWIRNFLDEYAAFIAALLYMFAPYRFVDLYVRGAIGEHVAFIFPPLVFYFLLQLSKNKSRWNIGGAVVSLAGLILSHNAISLMFMPLFILYAVYLYWQIENKKRFLISCVSVLLLGFSISAFFWLPAFMEGKYTLRDKVTAGEYLKRFVDFKDFIFGSWNYGGTGQFTVQVGVIQWLGVVFSLPLTFVLKKKNNPLWIFSLGIFIIFWITIFLMTLPSQLIWQQITMLQKFQFPWRFLSITVFLTSALSAVMWSQIPQKIKLVSTLLIASAVLFISNTYWHANGYLYKPESFYTSVYYGTTDTGESAPIWSVRFMENPPKEKIEIISGNGIIKQIDRSMTRHTYSVEATDTMRIRENTLFFPGWHVFVDGVEVDVQFQDAQHRGLLTFFVEKGTHTVLVEFKDTKLRAISGIISIIGSIIMVIYLFLGSKLWQRFR